MGVEEVDFEVLEGPEYWVMVWYGGIRYLAREEVEVRVGSLCIRGEIEATMTFPAKRSYILPAREVKSYLGAALAYAVKELAERARKVNGLVEEYIAEGFKIGGLHDNTSYLPFFPLLEGEARVTSVLKALQRAGLKAEKLISVVIKHTVLCGRGVQQ